MTPTEREARELFDTLDASTGRVLGRETAMPILLAALTRAEARGRAEGLREAAEIAKARELAADFTARAFADDVFAVVRQKTFRKAAGMIKDDILSRAAALGVAEKGEAV